MTETKHSRYSPSNWASWDLCRHFEPSPFSTGAATQGTNLHEALENPDNSRDHFDEYEISLLSMIERFLEQRYKEIGEPIKIFKEYKINLQFLGLDGVEKGTADLVVWNAKTQEIYLFDYKFGIVEVDDAEHNWQQKGYALGLFHDPNFKGAKKCWVHLLQPKRDEISVASYSADDAPRMKSEIKNLITEVQNKETQPYNLTDKSCRYCAQKGKCEAYQTKGIQFMENHATLTIGQTLPVEILKKSALEMSPVERGQTYAFLKLLEDWIKAKKSDVTSCAQEGSEVEGFALKSISGKRSIEDAAKAHSLIGQMPIELFLNKCKISVTEFEKVYAEVNAKAGKTKKALKEECETELSKLGILVQEPGYSYLSAEK